MKLLAIKLIYYNTEINYKHLFRIHNEGAVRVPVARFTCHRTGEIFVLLYNSHFKNMTLFTFNSPCNFTRYISEALCHITIQTRERLQKKV